MSVVVLNIEEEKMYSDTAVSFGSVDVARYKKTMHVTHGGYQLLMGGVGIPEAIDVMQTVALTAIERIDEQGIEPGTLPSLAAMGDTGTYTSARDMINTIFDKTKQASDLLILAKHIKTSKVYVGVMNDSALIQWNAQPVLGDNCMVIGSVECVTAWNATDRSSGMYSRLSALQRVVQFLKSPNEFIVMDINGKTDTYIPD